MEEKKNNAKGVIIGLIIGILLCVIGICVYLVVNKSNEVKNDENKIGTKVEKKVKTEEESKQEIKEENKIEEISINDELVKSLASKTIMTETAICNFNSLHTVEKKEMKSQDVSYKLHLAAETIKDKFTCEKNQSNPYECSVSYIDENILKDAYIDLFGENSNYARTNFDLSLGGEYHWSYNSNRYEAKNAPAGGFGGTCYYSELTGLAKTEKLISNDEELITIYEYYGIMIFDNVYESVKDNFTEFQKSLIVLLDSKNTTTDNVNVENYKDKLSLFKYTFKKENNRYVFVSVEKVK